MSLRNKEYLRLGLESTYGAPAPSMETALLVGDVDFNPSLAAREQRGLNRYQGGNDAYVTGYKHVGLGFTTEFLPALVAGESAPWGIMALGCGFAETLDTVAKTATYNPILLDDKSLSGMIYKNSNRHKMLGLRGALKASLKVGSRPTMSAQFSGLDNGMAFESPTLVNANQGKLAAIRADELTASLGGTSLCLLTAELDWGTQVAHTESSCDKWVITDHKPAVNLTIEMPDFNVKNWILEMQNEAIGVLDILWGTGDFKTRVKGPRASLGQVTYGRNGAGHTMTLPLAMENDLGNDSLIIETGNLS